MSRVTSTVSVLADELEVGTVLGNGFAITDIAQLDGAFIAYSWRDENGEAKSQIVRRAVGVQVEERWFSRSEVIAMRDAVLNQVGYGSPIWQDQNRVFSDFGVGR